VLNRKKSQQIPGFTWIELLVVMVIIGILAAIVLPSFLNSGRCCKCGSGVQQYVGSLARAQQVFLLEKKHFASSMAELGQPGSSDPSNYSYSIANHKTKAFVFGKSQKPLESYVAGVFVNLMEKNTSTAIVCKAKEPGRQPIAPPIDANTCGEGTVNVEQKK
jgi:type IV pilus assembly protein PilA